MRYYINLKLLLLTSCLITGSAFSASATPVVSGGVGEAGAAAVEQVQDKYNLKMVFTGERGMYLAGVNVTIRDLEGNEVAHGTTEGPMLLADLAPGRYTVIASAEGFSRTQNVTVGEKLKTYQMSFPIRDEFAASPAERMNAPAPASPEAHRDNDADYSWNQYSTPAER